MSKTYKQDFSGKEFGSWKVLHFHSKPESKLSYWWCRCICGTERAIPMGNLKRGVTVSCGCSRGMPIRSRYATEGAASRKGRHPLYHTWNGMISRCHNPKHGSYKYYGAQGIRVCQEWLDSFSAFAECMGERPSLGHTVDRIDNDGDYEPGNVRWATWEEQNANKPSAIFATKDGRTQTIAQWAKELEINPQTLYERIRKSGMAPDEAIAKPIVRDVSGRIRRSDVRTVLTHDDKTLTFDEWAVITGIHPATLANRKKRGWSDEKTLTTPVQKRTT